MCDWVLKPFLFTLSGQLILTFKTTNITFLRKTSAIIDSRIPSKTKICPSLRNMAKKNGKIWLKGSIKIKISYSKMFYRVDAQENLLKFTGKHFYWSQKYSIPDLFLEIFWVFPELLFHLLTSSSKETPGKGLVSKNNTNYLHPSRWLAGRHIASIKCQGIYLIFYLFSWNTYSKVYLYSVTT